jgi:hypothetical protein
MRDKDRRIDLVEIFNLVHRSPASICFNSNPADSVDAARCWIAP